MKIANMVSKKQKQTAGEKKAAKRKAEKQTRKAAARLSGLSSKGQLQHSVKAQQSVLRLMQQVPNAAKRLVLGMAEPAVHAMRLPTQYPCETALVRNIMQFTVSSSTSTPIGFNEGDLVFALIGQPALQMMMWRERDVKTYYAIFPGSKSGATMPTTRPNMTAGVTFGNAVAGTTYPINLDPRPVGLGESGALTGSLPVGTDGDDVYVFLNIYDKLELYIYSVTAQTVEGNLDIEFIRWGETETIVAGGSPIVSAATAGGALVCSTALLPYDRELPAGWYRIRVLGLRANNTGSLGELTYEYRYKNVGGAGWDMFVSPDLVQQKGGDPHIGQSCRTVGSSLLVTNTTAMVNRQGTVLAARILGDVDVSYWTASYLQAQAQKYPGDAALGVYTFKEIVEYNDAFRSVSDPAQGVLQVPLDRMGDYTHLIQVSCPTAATQANSYTVSVGYAIEFKTTIPRYQREFSVLNLNDAIVARKVIAGVPEWFYENPNHMRALYNLAKTAFNQAMVGLNKVAPYVTTAGRAIAPQYAPLYNAIDYISR